MTPEEHGWFRAVALGLPSRDILYVTLRSRFRLGNWPSHSPNWKILIRDS